MLSMFVVIALAGALHYLTRPRRHTLLRDRTDDVLLSRAMPARRVDFRSGRRPGVREPERIPARW